MCYAARMTKSIAIYIAIGLAFIGYASWAASFGRQNPPFTDLNTCLSDRLC